VNVQTWILVILVAVGLGYALSQLGVWFMLRQGRRQGDEFVAELEERLLREMEEEEEEPD